MSANEIREILSREPFEPFRIRLSSGTAYEIHDPQSVALMKSRLFIAFPRSNRWTFISFLHIAAIEAVQNGRAPRRHRRT